MWALLTRGLLKVGTSPTLMIGMVVAFLLVGGIGGSYISSKIGDIKRASAVASITREYNSRIDKLNEDHTEQLRIRDERISSFITAIDRIRGQVAILNQGVLNYVPENPACDLTVGAVGVLNSARGHGAGLPAASASPDEVSRAPSTVTQQAEVTAHVDCSIRYRELAARHNELVLWIEQTYGAQ